MLPHRGRGTPHSHPETGSFRQDRGSSCAAERSHAASEPCCPAPLCAHGGPRDHPVFHKTQQTILLAIQQQHSSNLTVPHLYRERVLPSPAAMEGHPRTAVGGNSSQKFMAKGPIPHPRVPLHPGRPTAAVPRTQHRALPSWGHLASGHGITTTWKPRSADIKCLTHLLIMQRQRYSKQGHQSSCSPTTHSTCFLVSN